MELTTMTASTILSMFMSMSEVPTTDNFVYNAEMEGDKITAIPPTPPMLSSSCTINRRMFTFMTKWAVW